MSADDRESKDVPLVIVPRRRGDARGWFSETFRENRLAEVGIPCRFVQDNESFSRRAGTLRGMHFQLPPSPQAKLVGVCRGRVLDIVVDIRNGSPTYGRHISIELSAENGQQFYVPVGFAHGFLTLEDETVVGYKVSDYYAPACDSGLRWNDPDLALPWPINDATAVISDKDRQLQLLSEFASPFKYDGGPLEPITPADFVAL
jgi:dTDP-4-dehydrorhamnose 3,5-epimerase